MNHKTICIVSALLFSLIAVGQITVKGKVVDIKKEPIIGVNVALQGSKSGTTTDFDGNYSITVPNAKAQISFSFIGFESNTVTVGDNEIINITLLDNASNLDEVVVIGFASVKKKDVTSSISSVKGKDIKASTVGNVNEALQGKVSGVQVVGAGGPGAVPKVFIRGISTINLSTDPLYVVDGVPIGTNINFLNPNEIESLDVLKDASASAIYGSRGSNGVIMITTKRGKSGETRFNFDISTGSQLMEIPYNMSNAEEYASIFNTANANAGLARPFADPSVFRDKTTDWWNAGIRRLSAITNMSLGFQGGSEKHTFAVSLNYFNQESFYENGGWDKVGLRIASDYKFSKKFSAGYVLNPRYESYGNPGNWADFVRIDPITPIFKPADQLTGNENEFSIYARSPTFIFNPVAANRRFFSSNKNYAIASTGYVQYSPIKDVIIRSQGSYELNTNVSNNFYPDFVVDVAFESQLVNSIAKYVNVTNAWTMQNTMTYLKEFNDKHNISLMVGNTLEEFNGSDINGSIQFLPNNSPILRELRAGTLNPQVTGSSFTNSILSYLSRLSYNYEGKYYLTATYRRDGSSKFLANNKWASFPSASVAWIASKEDFMSKYADVLTNLKFRLGWGRVGNQNLPGSVYLSRLGQNFTSFGNNVVNTSFPSAVQNRDIKWEIVEDLNSGIDFGFLQNKLTGSLEFYTKTTNDMLFQKSFPVYSGYPNDARIWSNVGSMTTDGIDFSLAYNSNIKSFNYGANLNFTTSNVRMSALSIENEQLFGNAERTLTVQGDEPGYFYGFVADGLFQNKVELNSHTNERGDMLQPLAQEGDIRFLDINNDGVLDGRDRTKIGSPWAKYTFGLNLNCSYKGFDFLANIYSSIGNDIVNTNRNEIFNAVSPSNKVSGLEKIAWHGEGTSNTVPRLSTADNNQNFSRFSSYYVEDGSFVRLKNVQLGYTFEDKFGFNKIRCTLSGQNLITLTKYTGVDPEVGGDVLGFGFGGWNYPVQEAILLGLNLTF